MTSGNSLMFTGIMSLLIFLALLLSYPPVKAGMYVAGFTGAGIQILLIMVTQSLYGFAYLVAPILITIFMAGIVVGVWSWKHIWGEPSISKYTGLLWIMALSSAAGVILLKTEQLFMLPLPGQLTLGVMNFIPGMIVGSIYGMSLGFTV